MKRSPLIRKSGLKRGGPIARKNSIRCVKPKRFEQLKRYWKRVPEFLVEHPVCQVWLAEMGFQENQVRQMPEGDYVVEITVGYSYLPGPFGMVAFPRLQYVAAPRSSHVHHRNKRRGSRLLDESEWMAVSRKNHERIEGNKAWAREKGYLRNF